jgi:hypothetical protein
MQRYLFVPRVLTMIEHGHTFRVGVSLVLRVAAAGIGLLATISWIGIWALARSFEAAAVLGLIVFQALFVVAAYAILHTILIRARDIRSREEGEFVILPIVATCCRLLGECLAWFFCAFGVGGALLILLAGPYAQMATSQMPFSDLMSPGVGAVGAGVYLVFGIVAGFAALVFFYLIAESSSLLAAIARNTEAVRKIAERYGSALP